MRRVLLRDLFFTRRSAALAMLGFAGGLPYVVATVTIQGYFTSAGMSEEAIGFLSLLLIPYALKVLWAPLVDAIMPPRLRGMGRRRGWITMSQVGIAAALAAVAISILRFKGSEGEADLQPLLWAVFAVALVMTIASATQDVAADAYRIDVSPPETRAAAASVFVMGYRAALALLGAGSLVIGGRLSASVGQSVGWSVTFFVLAFVMFAMVVVTWNAPEPPDDVPERAPLGPRLVRATVEPFRDLSQRFGSRLFALLFFIFIFKLPDNLALPMTLPFLHKHLGYDLETIGWVRQAFGLGVTIGGALLGAVIVPLLGMRWSLLLFGVVQATSTASFAWLAMHAESVAPALPGQGALAMAVVVEYLGIGLVTAGFVAFLMSICTARYSATQFALLTAIMTLGVAVAGTASGWIYRRLHEWSGAEPTEAWVRFFLLCVASGVVGLVLVPFVTRSRAAELASTTDPRA